jgi:hypothetical protein
LGEIISPVRKEPSWGVLKLVARFEFFLVGVAIGAEGCLVAKAADLLLLGSVELVPQVVV